MKRAYVMGVLLGLCGWVVGCSEEAKPADEQADQGMEMGMDLGADQAPDLMPDMEPDQAMCAPQTLCLPGECGQVDNGCGGQLDCGVCLCKDGQAQVPSCGTCELGTISCAMGDRYPSCEQPRLPAGVQLDCDAVVYFDPTAPQTGMGTREVPYSNLDEAVARVNALGGGAVVMGGDVVVEFGREVELPEAVMLLGGFDAQTFAYNPTRKPTLRLVPSQPTHGAILVQNASRPTLLHNLKVEVSAGLPGLVLHGIRAVSSPGLVLSRVELVLPDGVVGFEGAPGVSGEDGTAGTAGRMDGAEVLSSGGPGRSCGGGATVFYGGRGGAGGTVPGIGGGTGSGGRGGAGQDAPGGMPLGGVGGTEGVQAPNSGQNGGPGGAYPTAALPGMSGESSLRVVEGARLAGSGDGQAGANGGRGASGGGGGGSTYCPTPHCQPARRGVSGGSGGGGGCGGQGGKGGQAGSSLVGLLAVDSTGLTLLETTITVGKGGDGAKGGPGGAGGQGGIGGEGMVYQANMSPNGQILFLFSGIGGQGGPGQRGGAGGGGAGGSVYGVWCENSRLRDVMAQASVTVGAAGKGAQGAPDGVSLAFQGCTP